MDKKQNIIWLNNVKLLGTLGVLTFHFYLYCYPFINDISKYFIDFSSIIKMPFDLMWQANFLFFITSGIGLSLKFKKDPPKSILKFYVSRFKRIYIPYWLTIAFVLVIQFLNIYIKGWFLPLSLPVAPMQWIENLILFKKPESPLFSEHFWYLFDLVELYVLFPFLYKFSVKTKEFGLAIVILLHFLFNKYGLGNLSAWLSIAVWGIPFYLGIYLGNKLSEDCEKTEIMLHKLFPLGILSWLIGTIAYFEPFGKLITYPMLSFGIFVTVFKIASLNFKFEFPYLNKFASLKSKLIYLNKISYEIYLVHQPFMGTFQVFFGFVRQPLIIIYIIYLIITFVIASALHFIVNKLFLFINSFKSLSKC